MGATASLGNKSTVKKSTSQNNSKQRRTKYKRYGVLVLTIILLALLLVSIGCELVFRSSISAQIRLVFPKWKILWVHLKPFLGGKGILKVAETIGFSSILVAWIYAALDKTEFGVCYGDLVQEIVPCYVFFVIVHFVCILLCVFLSTVKLIESAWISLAIILLNGGIQCKILLCVILSAERRKRIAIMVWDGRISDANPTFSLEVPLNIAGAITEEVIDSTEELQKRLSNAMDLIIKRAAGHKEAIENIGRIWTRLLYDKTSENQIILSHNILKENPTISVGAGYMLWGLQVTTRQCLNDGKNDADVLLFKTQTLLQAVAHGTEYMLDNELFWKAEISLLAWMFFLRGDMGVHTELMYPRCSVTAGNHDLFEAISHAYLGNMFDRDNFEVAWEQIN